MLKLAKNKSNKAKRNTKTKKQSESPQPLPSGSFSELPSSELPSSTLTSLQQSLIISWDNTMRYVLVLILLASLSPIGLMYRLMPLNPSLILNGSRFMEKITSYDSYKFVFLSYVAAFALSYVLNYRKMKNPKEIAIMFLQVMIIFPLIFILCEVFGEVGLDPDKTNHQLDASQDSADTDKSDVPLTPSNANANDNAAWYYSKKFWGCVMIVGLAAIVYYGFYKPLMRRSNYVEMVELLYGFVNTSKLLAELKYHLLSTGLTTLIVHFLFHISSSPNQMGSNPARGQTATNIE